MKKLPIGIQGIQEILKSNFVYVDKTTFVKNLIDNGKHYFISRPRRFGKSLFLSTLGEVFKGNKELFKECDIYDSDYDWQEYPVILFDFTQILSTTPQDLEVGLQAVIQKIGNSYGISIDGPSAQFQISLLVEKLAKKNRVVVLVDEYDQPIINNLQNSEVLNGNRNLLKNFFGTLKSLDPYLKFTFITGVSKFSQVSLFSGPNNLRDITMDPNYATMMGYTEEELKTDFQYHIEFIAKKKNEKTNQETIIDEIRKWYNGYRFSEKEESVYNPYSTLLFLSTAKPKSYWYGTGTPSFLIHEVQKHPQSVVPLNGISAMERDLLDISSFEKIDLAALMFQTGYLTIHDYKPISGRYYLGFPNQEVQEAFLESLIRHFAKINPTLSTKAQEMLEKKDFDAFFKQLKALLASFPYQLFVKASEATYQSMILGLLKGMEFEVYAEDTTNLGRTDLIIELEKATYLFEFKLNKTPEIALKQIHQKKYFEKYTLKSKEIILLGINISSESRNISAWKGEVLSENGNKIQDL